MPEGFDSETPSQCPKAPTGLGNSDPPPPKGPCSRASFGGNTELSRWHFCLDSDEPLPSESLQSLPSLIAPHPRHTRYRVLGHASTDGDPNYNFRLACHRAHKVGDALIEALRTQLEGMKVGFSEIAAEIQDSVLVASRGATNQFPGGPASNRVVVLYADIPGGEPDEEPTCAAAPRHIGDIKPDPGCDPATLDLLHQPGSPQLTHFHFCLDSDVLAATGPADIAAFAHSQAATAAFVVHGFSSVEGDAEYNRRLSCHRALRLARELVNAGVPSERIREVSGLGETDELPGGREANRVAIVFAEGGRIGPLNDPPRTAVNKSQKAAIAAAAKNRILAGQYRLEADAYIAYWTCGHTPTVRQAVERLNILVPEKDDKDVSTRVVANGVEEGIGVNTVLLSNVALHADNPLECVMGRLIDMAFHHAVINDPELSDDLKTVEEPSDPRDKPDPLTLPRHLAGLHLVALAGLSRCAGKLAEAEDVPGKGLVGVSEPLETDPRVGLPPPPCARAPLPTRLLPPTPGEKKLGLPDFTWQADFQLHDSAQGPLARVEGISAAENAADPQRNQVAGTSTLEDVVSASAQVSLIGDPRLHRDYEVGFVQTILDDLLLAEYITGWRAVQKLPTPIRAAQMRGETPVPVPWMSSTAKGRPDSNGIVPPLTATWRLGTDFATYLSHFFPKDIADRLDTWQRHTRVAIWLVARRMGAPLDRFSTLVLDGITYDVTQNFGVDIRRVGGDLSKPETAISGGERELAVGEGEFRSTRMSDQPADPRLAKFDGPVASSIDLDRQATRFLSPDDPKSKKSGGLTDKQFEQFVIDILDQLELFRDEPSATEGANPTVMKRLGFIFSDLDVEIPIDSRSGRIGLRKATIRSSNLGEAALFHLSKALTLRLQRRDFLKQGRFAILANPPQGGVFRMKVPRAADEPDLGGRDEITADMANMFACTLITVGLLDDREFGASYWIDRGGVIHREPHPDFAMSPRQTEDGWKTSLPCGSSVGLQLGTIHTHPQGLSSAHEMNPSDADVKLARNGVCGRQHFIVSRFGIVQYNHPDGKPFFRPDITSAVKAKMKNAGCAQVKSDDDLR